MRNIHYLRHVMCVNSVNSAKNKWKTLNKNINNGGLRVQRRVLYDPVSPREWCLYEGMCLDKGPCLLALGLKVRNTKIVEAAVSHSLCWV